LAKLGTAVERLLGIKYPVLLGGMAGITDHALTSAVSEAGGLGTLAGALETGDTMSAQIKKTRELTGKPFAVNIPIHSGKAEELVEAVIRDDVRIVITSAGDPGVFTKRLKEAGITVIHVVPTPRLARRAEEAGVDAVIAEGFESGGRASKFEIGTLALIPQVSDAVKIPVIAAGGISDARGYLAARILGASGVSIGTAFLACRECRRIGDLYREKLLAADASDTAIAARGLRPSRVLKNSFYHTVEQKLADGSSQEEIMHLIYSQDLAGEERFFSCGQGVGLIKNIRSAGEIIQDIVGGAGKILREPEAE